MKLSRNLLGIAVATALAGVAGQAVAADIRIAVAGPVTGPVAQYGDMQMIGAEMAIEQINAKGGIKGDKLVMVKMDDACEPKQSPTVANQVVNDGIKFVVGHLCSGATKPAAKIYDENDVLMVSPAATNDAITAEGFKMVFRTIGKDSQQGPAAGKFIVSHLKPKALAIIHDKQSYGQGIAEQVRETAMAAGVKPVMFEGISKGDTDFSALITKLKTAGADVIYYGGYHPELGLLLRQAKEQGLQAKWMGPEGVGNKDLNAIAGDAVEGLYVTLPQDFTTEPENAALVKAFKDKGQDPSGPFVLTSYAAVEVIADSIKAVGADPVKVADYMRKHTFKTPIGELGFTASGDLKDFKFVVYEWHKDASKTAVK
ncbi:high-affinity branched-chain amino acid ABC transporter substrate-binding protein [Plasticicumulans acidivorans]|uniref:Branched-chain amino acid transport system substrate-binding protein n=1 Tax=Plasticicumulans acidivorans TaxID=886464 RepID=A0A317N0Z6_9GAMM|nr:high-affinity branched-chain amino acid ABC transporter substrate-binding protein [Plasticicumulans acidivorans]PWV65820.1 branched-chain amino acid transport system substrate-binding protein [Plasticicumulans acidivorans]